MTATDPMHQLAHAEAKAARGCSIEGCDRRHKGHGLCVFHLRHAKKAGSLDLKPRKTTEERFWEKVDRRGPNECWPWIASLTGPGYAQFFIDKDHKSGLGHRYAYELLVGPIPAGLVLDHLCRNPRCVNPNHLEAVTHRENVIRGEAPAAAGRHQAAKTHCPKGHPYDEANTTIRRTAGRHGGGGRGCKQCARASAARRRALKRAERQAVS